MAASSREWRAHARGTNVPRKLRAILRDGGILGDKLGVPGKERDAMYAVAYAAYAKGQYERARQLFAQLAFYDHQDPRYMKGLAASAQMLGNYEQALQLYVVIAAMDMTDPVPVMHAGDCFNAMNRRVEAAESFDLARSLCKGAEHRQVRQRCEQLLGSIKQFAA
jgi:type III secretion system low calcium response chaperone LcrH/SycD